MTRLTFVWAMPSKCANKKCVTRNQMVYMYAENAATNRQHFDDNHFGSVGNCRNQFFLAQIDTVLLDLDIWPIAANSKLTKTIHMSKKQMAFFYMNHDLDCGPCMSPN